MKLALALTAGTAAAFVAPSAPATKTQLAAAPVQEWAGATAPFGFFDPLGLSKDVDAGRLAFYRECEIKHGRVAMLATVGYLTGAAGITFPGDIANGVSFASVNADGARSEAAKSAIARRGDWDWQRGGEGGRGRATRQGYACGGVSSGYLGSERQQHRPVGATRR